MFVVSIRRFLYTENYHRYPSAAPSSQWGTEDAETTALYPQWGTEDAETTALSPQWGTEDAEIKDLSVENQELTGSSFKDWYMAMHATLTVRDFFLANFYLSGPFS